MKYVYIHGFGSVADPDSPKVKALGEIGEAFAVGYDSTDPAVNIEKTLFREIEKLEDAEMLLVGTSLGAYWAARMSKLFSSSFVAINPCLNPKESLAKYDSVTKEVLDSYKTKFAEDNDCEGLIILDLGDELFDSNVTLNLFKDRFRVVTFEGGNHRFAHIDLALPDIKHFADNSLIH